MQDNVVFSLDALEQARSAGTSDFVYVWNILPMEEIIDKAFWESDLAYQDWIAVHKNRADNFLDIAARYKMHIEFLSHAVTEFFVGEALGRKFGLEAYPIWSFYKHVAYEIMHAFYDRLRGKPSLKKILQDTPTANILISGWGRDISRAVDINVFKDEALRANITPIVNLVWRAPKIRNLPASTKNFITLNLRETLKKHDAYGPAFSLFSPIFWFKQFGFYYRVVKPRLIEAEKNLPKESLLRKLLLDPGFKSEFIINIIFAYHDAYLSHKVIKEVIAKVKPMIFVGSDSSGVSARAELFAAKEVGVFTISTPHAYQAYGMLFYNYLADMMLTHGPATARILNESGVSKECIKVIGTSHIRREKSLPINQSNIRIVLGTRSWGGRWSNYCSKHNEYDRQLHVLLEGIKAHENFDLVIKSHPNGDYHKYYDLLEKKFATPRIRHIPKGWKVEQFADSTDILVCMGEMPSFYISALYLKIPIIFITGTMTKTQKKLHYDYEGLGSVVQNAEQALSEIEKISSDSSYYESVIKKQNEFAKGYDLDKPEEKLLKIISAKL